MIFSAGVHFAIPNWCGGCNSILMERNNKKLRPFFVKIKCHATDLTHKKSEMLLDEEALGNISS